METTYPRHGGYRPRHRMPFPHTVRLGLTLAVVLWVLWTFLMNGS